MYYRIPLTVKLVALSVVTGIVLWVVLDYIQSRRIKDIFLAQSSERLQRHAMDDRLHLDRYMRVYRHLARLFVIQKNFSDYVESGQWRGRNSAEVIYHKQPPKWFSSRSLLYALACPRYAVLIDPQGNVREVYQDGKDPVPPALLHPGPLMIEMSRQQSYLLTLDAVPFLVTSALYTDASGKPSATLMLATPINEQFLIAALGGSTDRGVTALLTPGDNSRVLTSSDPLKIPPGAPLEELQGNYLMTGKEFFDYGSSELSLKFASFLSMAEVNSVTGTLIMKERKERALSALVLIAAFAIVTFYITQRIQRLTRRVADFSQHTLGVHQKEELYRGDQLHILEERFRQLTVEVVRSREIIKRDAEEQTRLIVGNAFDAIITTAADDVITTWNPRAETMFGWSRQEALGRKMSGTIIPPGRRESFVKNLEQLYVAGHGTEYDRPFETIACHREGREFPVELTVSCAQSEGGYVSIAVIRDISERRRLEDEAKRIQARLIHANKMTSLGTLVSGVAHEINNPNSFIMSNAQLFNEIWKDIFHVLEEHYRREGDFAIGNMSFQDLQAHVPKLLNSIHKGTERIKNIVENLTGFARTDTGALQEEVDVDRVVENAVFILDAGIRKYTGRFHVVCADHVPCVKGSSRQLEQVVINLLMNSLQALDDVERGVWISTLHDGIAGEVIIEVKDEGCGIPADVLDRITEPFFTTRLDKGGTGLGLSISYAIIKEHKGSMEFRSAPGRGTTACVRLPVYNKKSHESRVMSQA